MITLEIPHVLKRGRAYRYRRVVPVDCRAAIRTKKNEPRKNWIHTWKAGTPVATVQREAAILAAKHDHEVAVARGQEVTPAQIAEAETRARALLARDKADAHEVLGFLLSQGSVTEVERVYVNALENRGRYVPPGLSLSAALVQDAEKYGQGRDPKPFDYAVASFVATIGDKDITAITRADVSDWIAAKGKDGQSPATIKRRLAALRAMINRTFLDLEIDKRNPFEKHRINGGTGGASDRLPFNEAMLAKIDKHLTSERLGHETRNIILLMRNTGAGPGEIGGLVVADVSLDGTIPFIWIRYNTLRHIKVRVKDSVRDRRVPLIGEALDAAKDAVKRATGRAGGKSRDHVALFPTFGASDRGADAISQKLNKFIRAAGVPRSPRLTAYSFRHTIKEALRSAGVADHMQRRIMGHAGHGVADRYGSSRARLIDARDGLERALEHLGDVDSSIYSEAERL